MSNTIYVFMLGGSSPIVVHPFSDATPYTSAEGNSIAGRYGVGEIPSHADPIRTELYAAMEKGARKYFLDKGYYLRLAMSAAVFVFVYLFLSIIVRDPVPLIDELLLGSLASAAVFFASERKALSSRFHLETVLHLRRALDIAYFSESRVVDLFEAWRDEVLALGPAAFYKADPVSIKFTSDETEEAAALCGMLAMRWKNKSIVVELYDATTKGAVPGVLLDKAARKLGMNEYALVVAYLRLIPLAVIEAK
jgi:hypothetical protein